MGGALASNIIKDYATETISICLSQNASCFINYENTQIVNIEAINGGHISFWDLNINNDVTGIKAGCINKANSNFNLSSESQAYLSQMAEAVVSDLGIGGSAASNITTAFQSLSDNISENFSQTCISNFYNLQDVSITASGGTINGGYLNINNAFKDVSTSCVNSITSAATVSQDIYTSIQQSATAKVEGILGTLIWALAIVLIVLLVLIFGGLKALGHPSFWIIIIVLIALYFVIAAWRKWWPF